MRRFSSKNHLVTLSDINITPLLDLAFVLLIIFVITTPLLEQGLELKLPQGGRADSNLRKEDFRTVEVGKTGFYVLSGQRLSLEKIEAQLLRDRQSNPNLAVFLRADKSTPYDQVYAVLNLCARHKIKVSLRSDANSRP